MSPVTFFAGAPRRLSLSLSLKEEGRGLDSIHGLVFWFWAFRWLGQALVKWIGLPHGNGYWFAASFVRGGRTCRVIDGLSLSLPSSLCLSLSLLKSLEDHSWTVVALFRVEIAYSVSHKNFTDCHVKTCRPLGTFLHLLYKTLQEPGNPGK